MVPSARLAAVEAADAFLADAKTLDGALPIWGDSSWGGELNAIWVILDSDGAPSGQLRFVSRKTDTSRIALNVIHANHAIWRIDLDDQASHHNNPPDAHIQGLPATVSGSHEHAWDINRGYVLAQDQWSLRYRRALLTRIRRLGQAILWLAPKINLTLGSDQRGFDGPSRSDLFDRSGQ